MNYYMHIIDKYVYYKRNAMHYNENYNKNVEISSSYLLLEKRRMSKNESERERERNKVFLLGLLFFNKTQR